ncbi:hypothetical protein BCR44DRAFT_1459705 [Catenaria anguillulae PL171]|uniref:Uncharacterized protein n=1 Tax=Catenaria anguillulae PL171 TaxID=765915 RepID=A0A1Y2HV57_9FUNG|nr:hypothetical protein BCR44DRAFT_1459705 [Catenaria anguillulae PL171]
MTTTVRLKLELKGIGVATAVTMKAINSKQQQQCIRWCITGNNSRSIIGIHVHAMLIVIHVNVNVIIIIADCIMIHIKILGGVGRRGDDHRGDDGVPNEFVIIGDPGICTDSGNDKCTPWPCIAQLAEHWDDQRQRRSQRLEQQQHLDDEET